MTNKIMQLNIVSAEGEVYSGDVLSLVISGDRGDLGIYTGHSALITSMKPGQVIAKDEKGKELVFYIFWWHARSATQSCYGISRYCIACTRP